MPVVPVTSARDAGAITRCRATSRGAGVSVVDVRPNCPPEITSTNCPAPERAISRDVCGYAGGNSCATTAVPAPNSNTRASICRHSSSRSASISSGNRLSGTWSSPSAIPLAGIPSRRFMKLTGCRRPWRRYPPVCPVAGGCQPTGPPGQRPRWPRAAHRRWIRAAGFRPGTRAGVDGVGADVAQQLVGENGGAVGHQEQEQQLQNQGHTADI